MIEQENRKVNVQLAMLAVGALALTCNLFLSPVWALYVNCLLAGIQAWLVCALVSTSLALRRRHQEAPKPLALQAATSTTTSKPYTSPFPERERWQNTDDFLAHGGGEIVLLEAVILD